jgi:hypothetical protein
MQSSDGTMHHSTYHLKDALVYLFTPQVGYFYEFSVNDQVLTFTAEGDSLGHPTFIVLTRVQTSSEGTFFEIAAKETSDNFATVSEEGYTGTVWVNVTVVNSGAAGSESLQVQVYQGEGNYTECGRGYSSFLAQTAYLQKNETTTLHFTFDGVETHNNTGCYGVYYAIN